MSQRRGSQIWPPTDTPLRPLVSFVQDLPIFVRSKFMSSILSDIRCSSHLCKMLFKISLDNGCSLVSSDARSSFTSIPISLTAVRECWTDFFRIRTFIIENLFLEILTFCLKSCHCQYQVVSYYQIAGVAMQNLPPPPSARKSFWTYCSSPERMMWHEYYIYD